MVNNVKVICIAVLKAVFYLSNFGSMTVSSTAEGSIAWEIGLEKGDKLLRINNTPVSDIIDYYMLTCERFLQLGIEKPSGEIVVTDIEKEDYDSLGVTFEEDIPGGIRHCCNKCVFCFIDQMPSGMRDTLYVKDDDYRHSFLYGNYISLTNLSQADWERIIRMRLSPLFVSVHSTNPRLRSKIFGNPGAGRIMEQLKYLADGGITLHAQVVVCPGINDGKELYATLKDLASLWPAMSSVSVVPVGVTKYQQYRYPFVPVDPIRALNIISVVDRIQKECGKKLGYRFAFAADELYIKADRKIPTAEYYEEFPQLENGVGLVRSFMDEIEAIQEELPGVADCRKSLIITGTSPAKVINEAVKHISSSVSGIDADVLPVENRFFGPMVTVTGLLTGQDIASALKKYFSGKQDTDRKIILSDVTLKADEDIFLDDYSVKDIERITGKTLTVVENNARGLVRGILGLEVL